VQYTYRSLKIIKYTNAHSQNETKHLKGYIADETRIARVLKYLIKTVNKLLFIELFMELLH